MLDGTFFALADTGSPVTLVSLKAIPKHLHDSITPSNLLLAGANGSRLKIVGTLSLDISFMPYPKTYSIDVVIADDICETVLLGSDFLTKHSCVLDFSQLTLGVGDDLVPLLKVTSPPKNNRTFDVKITKTVTIPARTVANNVRL